MIFTSSVELHTALSLEQSRIDEVTVQHSYRATAVLPSSMQLRRYFFRPYYPLDSTFTIEMSTICQNLV
jgi:hypothetical protein